MRTECPDIINDRSNELRRRLITMPSQRFDEALLSEFLSRVVERFGYAGGVERESVPAQDGPLPGRAVPFLEEPQHGRSRPEPFQRPVLTPSKRRKLCA